MLAGVVCRLFRYQQMKTPRQNVRWSLSESANVT